MANTVIDWNDTLFGVAIVTIIIAVIIGLVTLVHVANVHSDNISNNNTNVQIAKVHACEEIADINQRIACFAVIGVNDTTRK